MDEALKEKIYDILQEATDSDDEDMEEFWSEVIDEIMTAVKESREPRNAGH